MIWSLPGLLGNWYIESSITLGHIYHNPIIKASGWNFQNSRLAIPSDGNDKTIYCRCGPRLINYHLAIWLIWSYLRPKKGIKVLIAAPCSHFGHSASSLQHLAITLLWFTVFLPEARFYFQGLAKRKKRNKHPLWTMDPLNNCGIHVLIAGLLNGHCKKNCKIEYGHMTTNLTIIRTVIVGSINFVNQGLPVRKQ